jgi:hypothetical protein
MKQYSERIQNLKSKGYWYILPQSIAINMGMEEKGICEACGKEIEHSFFAINTSEDGEIETLECGCNCVNALTHGFMFHEKKEQVELSDSEMVTLFWLGHKTNTLGKAYPRLVSRMTEDEKNRVDIFEVNNFFVSLYDQSYRKLIKTGKATLSVKQYEMFENKVRE